MRHRRLLAGLAVAALLLLAALSPWREALTGFAGWARGAGAVGPAAFALAYAAGSVLALPVWPLTVAAGVAYGAGWGFALALPCGAAGASLAFLAGRTFLRERVARRLAREPRLAALDEALARQGAVLVLLLRLSPLAPYNVVNYLLSASRVGLLAFAGASLAGMAPITFAWAWAGATFGGIQGLSGRPPPGPAAQALQWGGLVATLLVVLLLGRIARRALAAAVPPPPEA